MTLIDRMIGGTAGIAGIGLCIILIFFNPYVPYSGLTKIDIIIFFTLFLPSSLQFSRCFQAEAVAFHRFPVVFIGACLPVFHAGHLFSVWIHMYALFNRVPVFKFRDGKKVLPEKIKRSARC